MTGKRFTFDEDVNDDRMYEMGVFLDNGEIMETTEVLECLNTLHEENQHLEYDTKRMVKFIMSKGYGLKDYLDFCKELEE